MIVYKDGSNWRIPRSIFRKNTATDTFQVSEQVRANYSGSFNIINWHRNNASGMASGEIHPFWRYSMNPDFEISENNYFGLFGSQEISFDTGISNPNQNGRYTAGLGEGTIFAKVTGTPSQDSNWFCDCVLKSKFPLNIQSGIQYRSRVKINSRTPNSYPGMPTRFYRLLIDEIKNSGENSVQMSEFRLFDIDGNNLAATYSVVGGNSPAGEGPTNLGDNNVNTKWLDFNKTTQRLYITLSTATTIGGYRWATANDSEGRDPKSWRLQVSPTGGEAGTWTTIARVTGYNATGTRLVFVDDWFLQPTILTGFWSAPTFDGADFLGSGSQTLWGPKMDFTRTSSQSWSGSWPWGAWSQNYFFSTKVLNFTTTFPSDHLWARPIIKIESQNTNIAEVNYKLDYWYMERV
jgi:hypothetical protein